MGPGRIMAKRSPYSYEVELDGNVRHYHANHLRKYHVGVESVLFDSSVYQFECDDDVNSTASSDDLRMNACAVVYESDRDFGYLELIPTKVAKPECHDTPSTKMHPLPDTQSICQDVSKKSKSKLIPVIGYREGYWQLVRPPEYSFLYWEL